MAQLTERIESLERQSAEWEKTGAKRFEHITKILGSSKFADEARKHLASYQKPKSVSFVDSLPKAPTGKILKRELRKLYTGE